MAMTTEQRDELTSALTDLAALGHTAAISGTIIGEPAGIIADLDAIIAMAERIKHLDGLK